LNHSRSGGVGRLEQLLYRSERWMYRGPRPNRLARLLNGAWARAGSAGLGRGRLVTLEVPGRRTGRATTIPLIVADHDGERYLVAMLGERADWVANVRAAGGRAAIHHGRREAVQLEEVGPSERSPIVRRHLEVAPAARSFIASDRTVGPAAFDAIASEVPVFRVRPLAEAERTTEAERPTEAPLPARGQRRRRVLAVLAIVVVTALGAGVASVIPQSGPAPLALPAAPAQAPVGPLDGRWAAATGSTAGFRVVQTVLGMHADMVGRTTDVAGWAQVADGQLARAAFTVDLASVAVDGKAPEQVAVSLDTAEHPTATIELAQPVALPTAFEAGATATTTATGMLSLRGETHPVTITLAARRDGPAVRVAGSMAIDLADWGVEPMPGYGILGSVADQGVAEFMLVLRPA